MSLLEDYLDVQIKDGTPDLFSNLAILKLYQFNPTMSNHKILIDILLLSLTSPSGLVDAADFGLVQGLALDRQGAGILRAKREYDEEENPEVDEVEVVVPFLRNCWSLLRECRFREFWNVWNEDKSEGAERTSTITLIQFVCQAVRLMSFVFSHPIFIPPRSHPHQLPPPQPYLHHHLLILLLHPPLPPPKVPQLLFH